MGYSTRNNGQITDFWPDDTADTFYLSTEAFRYSISEIMELCQEKWPGITMEEIFIDSQRIHTYCIYYDLHDPSDWTNFLVITRVQQ